MIDFEQMTPHELACYMIGEALINGESGANYKGKLYKVFYYDEGEFFTYIYKDHERTDSGFWENAKVLYNYLILKL